MLNLDKILNVLSEHSGVSYYFGDAIPPKKLQNAKTHIEVPSDEQIYALYDFTIFGSAKEGAVFTNKGVYVRYLFEKYSISYEKLGRSEVTVKPNGDLFIDGKKTEFLSHAGTVLCSLNRILKPMDTTAAAVALKNGDYNLCIELLESQIDLMENTPKFGIIEFLKIFIEVHIKVNDLDVASEFLDMLEERYGSEEIAISFIEEKRKIIHDIRDKFNKDLRDFKNSLENCRSLVTEGKFSDAVALLDKQELRDDFEDDTKKEYYEIRIEVQLGLEDADAAEKSIKKAHKEKLITSEEKSAYMEKVTLLRGILYEKAVQKQKNELNDIITACEKLESEGKIKEAIELLYSRKPDENISDEVKKEYYDTRIEMELRAEDANAAEKSIKELHDLKLINSEIKSVYMDKVADLKSSMHERYLDGQSKAMQKSIETAKMFQKYGILESASDTINAAISSASDEIIEEKVNAFKILVELLLDQFEYGQLYDLKGYYPKISKASMLGYDLDEKIEGHKAEHVDEYYAHLYGKAIYCMQNGKFKDAAKLIKAAKRVKNTFDVRCAEISLALLEFKYLKSRELIDTLIKDQGQYAGTEGIAESIEHFEVQYRELIGTISSMLKIYAINGNTDAALKYDGYEGFEDGDGLNLPSIAARFTNYDIISAMDNEGYDSDFTCTNDGFGFALLAAMQLDYDQFGKFILNCYEENYDDADFVINENLGLDYNIDDEADCLCNDSCDEDEAFELALKNLYDRCCMLLACLIDESCYNEVVVKLNKAKENQIALAEKMESELPAILKMIDDKNSERQELLTSAAETMKSFILDVPESRERKAEGVASDFDAAVKSVFAFANENAHIMKTEREEQVKASRCFVDEIEEQLAVWKSINREAFLNLFSIPSAGINYGEYNEANGMITISLGHRSIEVKMSKDIAMALVASPDLVSVDSQTSFEFTDSNELKVKHRYTYSMDDATDVVEFVDTEAFGDKSVVDEIIKALLNNDDE